MIKTASYSAPVAGLVALLALSASAGAYTWNVSTVAELQNAVENYSSGDEIVMAAGTYDNTQLTTQGKWLHFDRADVVLRGATGDPDDVVMAGPGMNKNAYPKEIVIVNADDVTVRDLSLGECKWNGIHIRAENDADRAWICNVKTFNIGERHIKVSTNQEDINAISDDVLVEFVHMSQNKARQGSDYIGGIDGMGVRNWAIRDCVADSVKGTGGGGRAGIFLWQGVSNCTTERNLIIGCDRGIAYGNPASPSHIFAGDHHSDGGIIRNNFVVRGAGIGLELAFTKDLKVYHNTVYSDDCNYFRTVHIYDGAGETTNLQFAYNIIRGQISENATGDWSYTGDITGCTPASNWFVDPLNGDLHLTENATAAIDQGSPLADVTDDYDQEARDSTPDIGADEVGELPPPTVEFDSSNSSGDESVASVNLAVSLSQQSDQTVTVDYAVTGGTAVDPNDYSISGTQLSFDPGVTTQYVPITVVDDEEEESNETIEVTLSDPVNATLGTNTVHTYTINDDDGTALPGQASNPSPADGATKVALSGTILSWTAGTGATSHDVYFGTNPTPGPSEFQGNQTDTTFDPGDLVKLTMYYWRIDEVNDAGTTTGVVWSFKTNNK